MNFPKGSEWRRWDLHVHTKGTNKNDEYKSENFNDFCIILFKKALENNIAAIGITDYFCIENYKKVVQFVNEIHIIEDFSAEEKEKIKKIFLIPNIELRMQPATDCGKLINIHCLFNPDFVNELDNHFFNEIHFSGGSGRSYPMNRKGMIDLGRSNNPDLDENVAYNKGVSEFVVSLEQLQHLKDGDKYFKDNVIIIVSNSNKDGASGLQNHYKFFEGNSISSLDGVRRAIYMLSDCVFSGNPKDAEYFSGKGKDSAGTVIMNCGSLKPCIHGSDAHTEDKLFSPDENRFCWIKADLTFNGLRQVLFEPFPGERVWIGQTRPDLKDGFKIIEKIKFSETSYFPNEIIFNQNLCSIVGSRSVGKSALLAYIADSVDTSQTREKKKIGPGEGFPWVNVDFNYSIEWVNGKSNFESPGKVVYIPQNFLYEMSGKPDEIKNKILPVLSMKLPQISQKYFKVERDLKDINIEIGKNVEKWFIEKNQTKELLNELRELGSENAVLSEKNRIDEEIKLNKEKYKLDATEVNKLQDLSEQIANYNQKASQIREELDQIGLEGEKGIYFRKADISLTPSISELPEVLQTTLNDTLEEFSKKIISETNNKVLIYNGELTIEMDETNKSLGTVVQEFNSIQEKQTKNEELESNIKKSSELRSTLELIKIKYTKLSDSKIKLSTFVDEILKLINQRRTLIEDLEREIKTVNQSDIKDMEFGIEAQITTADLERFKQKLNSRENTEFMNSHELNFDLIRTNPDLFLDSLFSGKQKVNQGNDITLIAIEAFTITEKILFIASMEGDRIGGFSEPTMTPGKRALFALRLLLAESEDTWPLLIDQPEDDLDSRSIYNDIVPFLREKKKERQIIMVSHNANLVIGADSEQIIVANRHGEDRKNEDGLLFNYLSGSIENSKMHDSKCIDTLNSQGVREHACQILEGGELAFELRSNRYDLNRERR